MLQTNIGKHVCFPENVLWKTNHFVENVIYRNKRYLEQYLMPLLIWEGWFNSFSNKASLPNSSLFLAEGLLWQTTLCDLALCFKSQEKNWFVWVNACFSAGELLLCKLVLEDSPWLQTKKKQVTVRGRKRILKSPLPHPQKKDAH